MICMMEVWFWNLPSSWFLHFFFRFLQLLFPTMLGLWRCGHSFVLSRKHSSVLDNNHKNFARIIGNTEERVPRRHQTATEEETWLRFV